MKLLLKPVNSKNTCGKKKIMYLTVYKKSRDIYLKKNLGVKKKLKTAVTGSDPGLSRGKRAFKPLHNYVIEPLLVNPHVPY